MQIEKVSGTRRDSIPEKGENILEIINLDALTKEFIIIGIECIKRSAEEDPKGGCCIIDIHLKKIDSGETGMIYIKLPLETEEQVLHDYIAPLVTLFKLKIGDETCH